MDAVNAELRAALEITADALDNAAEDAHAGWAYYAGDEGTTHSGPDDFGACLDSQCRRRQRYVEDARAALAATPEPLDVERLARALQAEYMGRYDQSDEAWLTDARFVIAEYARSVTA